MTEARFSSPTARRLFSLPRLYWLIPLYMFKAGMANLTYTKSASRPKWQVIVEDVMGLMESGEFEAGGDFPTLAALCKSYGVSHITGQRVFMELKKRGCIATRGRRGTVVTHSPGMQTVYICFRDECFRDGEAMLGNWWIHHEILMGLTGNNLSSLFSFKPISLRACLNHAEELANDQLIASADVVLSVDQSQAVIDKALLELLTTRFQPIFFHGFPGLSGVPSVASDLYQLTYQPMQHLLSKGYQRVALLVTGAYEVWSRARIRAYMDALHEAGLPFDPQLIQLAGDPGQQSWEEAAAHLMALASPPDAIACLNDSSALAILEYCAQHGIRVPEDLAVTGSNNRPETAFSRPPLTTVDGCHARIGSAITDLLNRRLRGEKLDHEPILIAPQLIHRKST